MTNWTSDDDRVILQHILLENTAIKYDVDILRQLLNRTERAVKDHIRMIRNELEFTAQPARARKNGSKSGPESPPSTQRSKYDDKFRAVDHEEGGSSPVSPKEKEMLTV